MNSKIPRRNFVKSSALIGTAMFLPKFNIISSLNKKNLPIVGHGDFKYRVNKEWGVQDPTKFPVKDCHEMVQDKRGRLILLTNETSNNVIIYDKSGKVLTTWGDQFPGAHGLTLVEEGDEEFLFITDHNLHQVFKTTLDGKILLTLDYPKETGEYKEAGQYKPTEVAMAPNGDFYVADGYGLDFIIQYDASGKYIRHFGGKGEGAPQLKNAHGVCLDTRKPDQPELLVTSRAAHEFKRFSLDGKYLETIQLPGCFICRPVIRNGMLYFAVIASKTWETYDGFVAILDQNNRYISAPGGSQPTYKEGTLQEIQYDGKTFLNPHDVCVDDEENLYIPQWNSEKTYPVKLERI